MIDVAVAIDAEAIDVTRIAIANAGGDYVRGKWIPKVSPPTSSIRATVQPVSGRTLNDLPEGIRSTAKYTIWTRSALVENDEVAIGADRFRVTHVWPRPVDGFNRGVLGMMTP